MNKPKKRGNLWRILVYDYTDENGKVHNKSISALKSKVEKLLLFFLISRYYAGQCDPYDNSDNKPNHFEFSLLVCVPK